MTHWSGVIKYTSLLILNRVFNLFWKSWTAGISKKSTNILYVGGFWAYLVEAGFSFESWHVSLKTRSDIWTFINIQLSAIVFENTNRTWRSILWRKLKTISKSKHKVCCRCRFPPCLFVFVNMRRSKPSCDTFLVRWQKRGSFIYFFTFFSAHEYVAWIYKSHK